MKQSRRTRKRENEMKKSKFLSVISFLVLTGNMATSSSLPQLGPSKKSNPDWTCSFSEPYLTFKIFKSKRFVTMENHIDQTFEKINLKSIEEKGKETTVYFGNGEEDNHVLEMVLDNKGEDPRSDAVYPYSAKFRVGDTENQKGGCYSDERPFTPPSEVKPRNVSAVAAESVNQIAELTKAPLTETINYPFKSTCNIGKKSVEIANLSALDRGSKRHDEFVVTVLDDNAKVAEFPVHLSSQGPFATGTQTWHFMTDPSSIDKSVNLIIELGKLTDLFPMKYAAKGSFFIPKKYNGPLGMNDGPCEVTIGRESK